MLNPIIQRELISLLKSKVAISFIVATAIVCTLLVMIKWPSDGVADVSGGKAIEVFRVFGYGLLISLLLFVPAFPATSIVKEKNKGTLALLFNSPMNQLSIYIGKFTGVFVFVLILMVNSLVSVAACYTMGGIDLWGHVGSLYAVLTVMVIEYIAIGLLVSSFAGRPDGAMRVTYGIVVGLSVVSLFPHLFVGGQDTIVRQVTRELTKHTASMGDSVSSVGSAFNEVVLGAKPAGGQGKSSEQLKQDWPMIHSVGAWIEDQSERIAAAAEWTRCLSPVAASMEIMGNDTMMSHGQSNRRSVVNRYLVLAVIISVVCMVWTISRLNYRIFDRSRSQGSVTDKQSIRVRLMRRLLFVVDPNRRKAPVGRFVNPVFVKEFRTRRFGRMHWLLRFVSVFAIISIGLTLVSTSTTNAWSPQVVGGIMVVLQVMLILLLVPSTSSGVISSEVESGGWTLLQMTRLPVYRIVWGKLCSALVTVGVILLGTLPGYMILVLVNGSMRDQVQNVIISLLFAAIFSVSLSAAVSSIFRRTSISTAVTYAVLSAFFVGTLLIWMGRDNPFGPTTVYAALVINPVAAAFAEIRAPGFEGYDLTPAAWWISGSLSALLLVVLYCRVAWISRPK